jgi:hypothetical protein
MDDIRKFSGYHPYQQVIQKVSGYSLVDIQKLSEYRPSLGALYGNFPSNNRYADNCGDLDSRFFLAIDLSVA